MSQISTSVDVNRPAGEVFAYATDPMRFHEWQQGVLGGHMDDPKMPGVGTRCHTSRKIGFSERSVTSEVTHIDPPHAWGVRGIDGPIRARVDVTVEELEPTRSRLVIDLDFAGYGIGKVLVPLIVRREARKEMPGNVAALKRNLES